MLFTVLIINYSAEGSAQLGPYPAEGEGSSYPDGHLESVPLLKQFSDEAGCAQGEIAQIQMLSSE